MFNPLPAIALLPLALIWFGLGYGSIVFVIVHSVLWAVALNTHSGFLSVSNTLRMVGRNYGLSGLRYVGGILIPAAFPSILTGLKIGWAFAWRTLIAAELVFGVSSGSGGLGWFIYENKNQLEIPAVFAGLLHRDPDRPRRRERASSARSRSARSAAGECKAHDRSSADRESLARCASSSANSWTMPRSRASRRSTTRSTTRRSSTARRAQAASSRRADALIVRNRTQVDRGLARRRAAAQGRRPARRRSRQHRRRRLPRATDRGDPAPRAPTRWPWPST